jgi:hypothetical protein
MAIRGEGGTIGALGPVNFNASVMPTENPTESLLIFHITYTVLYGAAEAHSAQRLGYGLDDRCSIPGGSKDAILSVRHRFQTGSGVHPAS